MKPFILILAFLCFSGMDLFAKAYFQTKDEMIEKAEVIAIISIGEVKVAETHGVNWTYRQSAIATVESVLKGTLPKTITLYGMENFPCAQCLLGKGRFIAFLKKDGDLWTGSNWHLSFRPIQGTTVEWYKAEDDRYEMVPIPLETVIQEIKVKSGTKFRS